MKNEMLKDIRLYKKMTLREFADWLDVSLATVSMVESGHRNVSENLASKVAHKFDIYDKTFREYAKRRRQVTDFFSDDDKKVK